MKRFLLLLLLLPLVAAAQDPNYIRIDKSKGLPSNSVYDIFQDSQGFIWAATDDGLCRYDGFRFRSYYNEKQTSRAGSNIREDVCGRIWYENFDGNLYYVQNDSLHAFYNSWLPAYVIYGLTKKTLFVVTTNGIDLYDLSTLRRKKTVPMSTNDLSFTASSGDFFYLRKDQLMRIDDNGQLSSIGYGNGTSSSENGRLIDAGKGGLWLYGKTGMRCFSLHNDLVQPLFTFSKNHFFHTASHTGNLVWFCSTDGAIAYSENGTPYENEQVFFPGKSISGVLCDRENNYWFSTTDEGLLFVSDIHSRAWFSTLSPTRLLVNGNTLFFGNNQGDVMKASLPEMKLQETFSAGNHHSIDLLKSGDAYAPLFLASDSFRVMNDGIVTGRYGIAIKDITRIAPGTFAYAATGLCGIFFAKDAPGNAWKHPLWTSAPADAHTFLPDAPAMFWGSRGKAVCADTLRQVIWIATNTGFFRVTTTGITEIKDKEQPLHFTSLLYCDNLVYALNTQGDVFTVTDEGHVEALNEKLQLPPHSIKGIKSNEQYIFFFCDNCICFVARENPAVMEGTLFTYSSDIYDIACWDGQVFASTPRGILSLDLRRQAAQTPDPRLVFGSVSVNGNATDFSLAHSFILDHNQNNLTIDYSVLSFKTRSAYPVYYRINQENWELAPPESRSLRLASLAPGDYTIAFRLGDEKENRAASFTLQFTIEKAWWVRWWAIAMYIAAFVVLTGLLYQRQLRIQSRKNKLITEKIELEKNLDRSVLTSIRSQMNPHFFYNALNTIQSFIYSNDKQNAGTYLSKFSRLTRMILEMSEREFVTLEEEITACRLYLELEQVRFNDDFSFSIDTQNISDPSQVRIPPMLIQPYIENAVKHGLLHKKGEKLLRLVFARRPGNLSVSIDDNGIGRERSAQLNALRKDRPASFSSEANQKRLELLNRGRENPFGVHITDKKDTHGQPAGTTVIIDIPV